MKLIEKKNQFETNMKNIDTIYDFENLRFKSENKRKNHREKLKIES